MQNQSCGKSHCCWCKVALAFGLANGLWVFIMGLLGKCCGYGLPMIMLMGSLYPGYDATVAGSFMGGFWAFLGTFVFFVVAGLIYRALMKCCNKCCCNKSSCSTEEACCDAKKCDTDKKA